MCKIFILSSVYDKVSLQAIIKLKILKKEETKYVKEGNVMGKILELKNISKSFPGVKALDNVSFSVNKGQVHVLVGENGAGKSTLIKIINGIYTADDGKLFFENKEVEIHTPKAMMDLGVATIHQELSPVLDLSIAENIFLGTESMLINWKEMYEKAGKLISDLGFSYNPREKMRTLTVSDMQIIEIIKAISKNAKVIIMDEPTSSITESEVAVLFEQIMKLKKAGIGIIYITHKMDEIFQIGDQATILRDGKVVSTHRVEELTKNEVIAKMVGREITDVYPGRKNIPGETVLEIHDLTSKKFQHINLKVKRGEILGMAGLVGAGRTEVMRALFGLDSYSEGAIYYKGEKLDTKSVAAVIDKGIMMVSEDRKGEGLILIRSVNDNISLPNLKSYLKGVFIDDKSLTVSAQKMIERLAIKAPSGKTLAGSLSGGNQQKIVIAKWLLHHPEVLILDEPTRGIDVGAKYEIYKIICDLAEQGVAIIMISSEMPEIIGMCDRVVVMSNGKITGELMREEVTQEKIMTLAVKGFEYE